MTDGLTNSMLSRYFIFTFHDKKLALEFGEYQEDERQWKMPFSNIRIQTEAQDHLLLSATEQKFIRE